MPLAIEDDIWQIDPITAQVRPDAALHDPVLIVVETSPGLARSAAEICDFLRIKLLAVQDPRDIADHLGMAPETVSRVLSWLQEQQLVVTIPDGIRVLDLAALEALDTSQPLSAAADRKPAHAKAQEDDRVAAAIFA